MKSRRILKGAFYLLSIAAIIAALIYSPLFTFQQLVVRGNVHLDEAELCEIARIQYGQRLFELKTDAMTTNLLHDLRIESAVVRRQLPNKIEMDIVERIPVATVACDYGYLDFDRQGKVIASYRALKGAEIPIVTGVRLRDLYIGDDNDNAQVAKVITFLGKIDPADIGQISEVNITAVRCRRIHEDCPADSSGEAGRASRKGKPDTGFFTGSKDHASYNRVC